MAAVPPPVGNGKSPRSPSPRKRRRLNRIPAGVQVGPASMALGTVTAVIDSHAYILPPFDAVNGANFQRLQVETGMHPTFTLQMEPEPRCFVDSSSLVDQTTQSLRDGVQWVRDELGRPSWTAAGKRYIKGSCPSHIAAQANAYPVEQLVNAMDFTDVAISILHHDPAWKDATALHREACRRHPHRFRRLVTIPDLECVPADMEAVIAHIDQELAAGGVMGFQFFISTFRDQWDGKEMKPLWDHLAQREVAVWFTCLKGHPKQFTTAAEELFRTSFDKIIAWCKTYNNTDAVITHGLPWRNFLHADRKGIGPLPKWVFKAAECPRLHLQLLIPSCIGDVFDFPYKEVNTMIERLAKRIGANRLLFGTEMPMLERLCTYAQSVQHIGRYCDFMTLEERTMVLGGNARKLIERADEVSKAAASPEARSKGLGDYYNEALVAVRVLGTAGQSIRELQTPCLMVDMDAFDANCALMGEVMGMQGVLLRPDVRYHRCSALARRQLEVHGDRACGVCCRTVREADAMVRGGVRDVMLTTVVADAQKAARMVVLAAQGAAVAVCVDSTKGLGFFKEALKGVQRGVNVDVMIELGVGARCGVEAIATDTAVAIAHTVEVSTGLRLRGVQVYAGCRLGAEEAAGAGTARAAGVVRSHVAALREAGIASKLVVGVEGAAGALPLQADRGLVQELQWGAYVFGAPDAAVESEALKALPAKPREQEAPPPSDAAEPAAEAEGEALAIQDGAAEEKAQEGGDEAEAAAEPAVAPPRAWERSLFVLGTVTGTCGRAGGHRRVLDVGWKALPPSTDGGVVVASPDEPPMTYTSIGDEHGELRCPEGSTAEAPGVGVRVQLGPASGEAAASLHEALVTVRGGVVEGVHRIDGRGY